MCEIDTGPLHFDSVNTTFVFFAVIGARDDGEDESDFWIDVEVFNNGEAIDKHSIDPIESARSARSDYVWLSYTSSNHSQLTTNNLRVKFKIMDDGADTVSFKSCGFHIIEQGYDDDADDYDDDDESDESDRNPIEQRYDDDDDDERHNLQFCSKGRRNDDDEEDGNGTHNKRHSLHQKIV